MIPSRVGMEQLAIAAEEVQHEAGWDEQPLLALVLRVSIPDDPDAEAYAVLPYFIQPADLAKNPAQALLYMGAKIRQDDAPPALPPSMRRHLAGVLFAGEGWSPPPELHEKLYADRESEKRRFADIPGALEVRFVHVLDCAGRYYHITRYRGQEPEEVWVVEPEDADEDNRMAGNIVVGLRDFLLGISKKLPADAINRDAIEALAREDAP